MAESITYRKQLLLAIEAFLEKTPSACKEALRILQPCITKLQERDQALTIDQIVWEPIASALADLNYCEHEQLLRDTQEILLGRSPQHIARAIFSDDYRSFFTANEMEWYTQLVELSKFLATIPFASIYEATRQARQQRLNWDEMRATIPEILQAEEGEAEYQERKALIEALAARSPSPTYIGEEKVYQVALREVTAILLGIKIDKAAVFFGYPVLDSPYTIYGGSPDQVAFDMTEWLGWAKRLLDALAGKGEIFLTWRFSQASTLDTDVIFVCFH